MLAVLDPARTVVYSQTQGEFESSLKIGPEDVVRFLENRKPTTKNQSGTKCSRNFCLQNKRSFLPVPTGD